MGSEQTVYEFFAPFAHIEGKYEACRIRSPTHGVFDTFIVLGESTAVPATVYVNDDAGGSFMRERYPECTTIRVDAMGLAITDVDDGRVVNVRLEAQDGPVHSANITFAGAAGVPKQVPYGGDDFPVWGGRFKCWGVDLNLDGMARGYVRGPELDEAFDDTPCIVTLGSFAKIEPL